MNNQERTIQRYLLGELPESEQQSLEQEYFNDQRLFEHIVQVENDLVDKYARGLLSAATRERFEEYYLAHSGRRERAGFAGALAARLGRVSGVEVAPALPERWLDRLLVKLGGPRLVWAFASVVLLITVLGAWTLMETKRLRRQELARTESERAGHEQRARELEQQLANDRLRAEQLSEEIERLRAEQSASPPATEPNRNSRFATLILTIGGTRDVDLSKPSILNIPSGAEQVRVQLNLKENEYSSYLVVVQSASGNSIFTSKRLTAPGKKSGASLTLLIPARLFSPGDYILTLKGFSKGGEAEDISKSLLRVERR